MAVRAEDVEAQPSAGSRSLCRLHGRGPRAEDKGAGLETPPRLEQGPCPAPGCMVAVGVWEPFED